LRIVRHSLLNLIGLGAPLLVAVGTIPILLDGLGTERFGLLTLIWALVSYLSFFDLGLGRALTLRLAIVLERGKSSELGALCCTALCMMSGVGLLAGLGLFVFSPWLLGFLRELPDKAEALASLQWLALALPLTVVTAGLRGVLEGCGAFGWVNGIRIPLGIWSFAGPVLALHWWGADLAAIAAVLLAGRLLGALAHVMAVRHVLPQLKGHMRWHGGQAAALLHSGGWLLLSNLLGPLMGYADRFIIGIFVPVAAVGYYATPQELVLKLWVLPGALMAVLFPALAARIAEGSGDAARLCQKALLGLCLSLLPITLGLATLAQPLLTNWLGSDFAASARDCLVIFSVGFFVTGLAQLPYTVLQSAGRAAVTAKLHLVELPFYVVAVAWAASSFGIVGVAWIWLARVVADAVLLFACAWRLPLRDGLRLFNGRSLFILTIAPFGFAGLVLPDFTHRVLVWLVVSFACLALALSALLRRSGTMRDVESS
jgi:O-antigen/teichoic acid export membrane protein